jgi:hypothetical protein
MHDRYRNGTTAPVLKTFGCPATFPYTSIDAVRPALCPEKLWVEFAA